MGEYLQDIAVRYDKIHLAQVNQVERAALPEPIDSLYDRVMKAPMTGKAGKPAESIERKGAIGLMVLPENWVPGPSQSGVRGSDYFISYHPPESSKTLISLSFNGRALDKTTAEQFLQLVDNRNVNRPAELSREERGRLANVFGAKSEPSKYQIDGARVETLDGRRVLVVNGKYAGSDVRETTVYVDADGKGAVIQELALQAPDAKFKTYEPRFKEMLEKLIWNPYK